MKPGDSTDRQRLALEIRHRRAELALARKQHELAEAQFRAEELKNSRSGMGFLFSPTGVVLIGAMLGLLGTALGKLWDNRISRRQLETSIILKASDVPASLSSDAQAVQRARNLLWFQRAGYISLDKGRIDQLVQEARLQPGDAIPAPVVQAPASSPSAGQTFNFLVLNDREIDESGWDIDVFSCTVNDGQAQVARAFAETLASHADRRSRLRGGPLGRIRFDASPDHRRPANQIFYDPNEAPVARTIATMAQATDRPFAAAANTEAGTPYYLSVYFCQA